MATKKDNKSPKPKKRSKPRNAPKRVENRVDGVPTQDVIDQALAHITAAKALLQPFLVTLDAQERISRLTPKHGHEKQAKRIVTLAKKYNLPLEGVSPEAMTRDLALYQALAPINDELVPFSQEIHDTYRQSGHEYWQAFCAYHAGFSGGAAWNPTLATEIKPIARFMSTKESASQEADKEEPTEEPAAVAGE